MEINEFLRTRRSDWLKLESMLQMVESQGIPSLDVDEVREFGRLYRSVSSDLILARSKTANVQLLSYLNDLVARSYSYIYSGRRLRLSGLTRFFLHQYPSVIRSEARLIAIAAILFFTGSLFGFVAMTVDEEAGLYLLPKEHMHLDPVDRVADLESAEGVGEASAQGAFSSFLFTHNIQVTFLVFALGLTFGAGTVIVLFLNGLFLGALAYAYHQGGVAVFFYSWILPHGVPELFSIFIAGGAGLIIGRAMLDPGDLPRTTALQKAAVDAVKIIMGTTVILVFAGVVEGTLSQIHEPVISYELKRAFAYITGGGLLLFFVLVGTDKPDYKHFFGRLSLLFFCCVGLEVILVVHRGELGPDKLWLFGLCCCGLLFSMAMYTSAQFLNKTD